MDRDPLSDLVSKVKILGKKKELLEKSLQQEKNDIEKLEKLIAEKEDYIQNKEAKSQESKMKLEEVEHFIAECETSLKKIVQMSLALEKSIDKEIEAY
jgi:predicted  nucleic acid-binding Zn-ribbon protein